MLQPAMRQYIVRGVQGGILELHTGHKHQLHFEIPPWKFSSSDEARVDLEDGRRKSKELAYALYSHRHSAPPKFGDLTLVFSGFHPRRSVPITSVNEEGNLFTTFFPLGAAVNRDIVEIVGQWMLRH